MSPTKLLNHKGRHDQKGVAKVYNRFEYIEERREALDLWAKHIESLIRPTPSNVVPLTAAR